MVSENTFISVALCTFNGAKYLSSQLDSILNQTRPADEIIIVDDCSTDGTLNIIKAYAAKTSIIKYFVNETNVGYVSNFSLAISKTRGDYVALSDQDDIWTKDHIEKLLTNIGDKAVCVGDASMIDAEGNYLRMTFSQIKGNFHIPDNDISKAYRIIYNYNPYQGASMLIDRRWVEPFLPIPPRVSYHDSYLAACASLTKGIVVIRDIITLYRVHNGQVTKSWRIPIWKELKTKHHCICFPNKIVIIDTILLRASDFSTEATAFINEFRLVLELDKKRSNRIKILRMKNHHYKDIYSCNSYRFILLRSLHFLLAF